MAKTTLDLTREEWSAYQPSEGPRKDLTDRWDRAHDVVRRAARLLREQFGARRVVVFGSLVHRASFTSWSDIDLAIWGMRDGDFFRAVAALTRLSVEFKIDLVDVDTCRPALHKHIEEEGIDV